MGAEPQPHCYTAKEYCDLEEKSELRHEFFEGEFSRWRESAAAPSLIVEVLSPSTESYDRDQKFNQYKKLPSLRHYLLVSQQTWLVEWYQLTEHGVWAHTSLAEANDTLYLPELALMMTLAEVYEEAGLVPMQLATGPDLTLPGPPATHPSEPA